MSKTLSQAFVTRAGCHVCAAVRKHPKLCHTPSPCVRAHACLCLRACLCVQACGGVGGAALRVAGLADCCIIFGRVAPSLWRASLKSAGSLPLPLLRLRESGQARLWGLAGGSSGTERCRTCGTPSATLRTDGWAAYWRWSPLVFSKWISAALLTGYTLLKE